MIKGFTEIQRKDILSHNKEAVIKINPKYQGKEDLIEKWERIQEKGVHFCYQCFKENNLKVRMVRVLEESNRLNGWKCRNCENWFSV